MITRVLQRSLLALAVVAPQALGAPSPEAAAYLDHAVDLMAQHALNRAALDFQAIRAQAYETATDAVTTADTWPAIRGALAALGDGHSALLTPGPTPQRRHHDAAPAVAAGSPHGHLVDGRIGYLRIPGYLGHDPATDTAFADAVQTLIFRLNEAGVCGWVVDLRDNPGGNMWPMLAGLAPLLGDGQVGAFVGANGVSTAWWVEDGAAGVEQTTHAASHYDLTTGSQTNVAVLHGPATASSGEAVAVAFRGAAGARSFGAATHGVSTGNRGFVLADGAVLFVTASRFADRTGRTYGMAIQPDEPAGDALSAASQWLQGLDRCRTMRR